MVTGATIAAFSAGTAGCGSERPDVRHVGDNDWAELANSVNNSNNSFGAGEECVVVREAQLILREGGVFYNRDAEPQLEDDGPAGTECPNGAKLNMTLSDVTVQEGKYQVFIQRRNEVTEQVEDMDTNVDESTAKRSPDTESWVDIVNPEPVASSNVIRKYGDTCNTHGSKSVTIGRLSTGESVKVLINEDAAGSLCPSGSIYLQATSVANQDTINPAALQAQV